MLGNGRVPVRAAVVAPHRGVGVVFFGKMQDFMPVIPDAEFPAVGACARQQEAPRSSGACSYCFRCAIPATVRGKTPFAALPPRSSLTREQSLKQVSFFGRAPSMCERVQTSTRAVFYFVWSLFLLQVEAQSFSRTRRERKAKFSRCWCRVAQSQIS
jgi:hypothetical protein